MYLPYIAEDLPVKDLKLNKIITLVGKSNAALAHYNGLLHGMVNPRILLSPLTNQEAVLSSKIEGTQATLEEVLEHEAGREYDFEKETDIREIQNYRTALALASEELLDKPISLFLIRQIHGILMDSVRGESKSPGSFRKVQNWIGRKGSPIEEASFVPPDPNRLPDFLEQWEQYLSMDDIDPLVQAGIVHGQFELLHPFEDGNGRIGRLLIPLFLYSKKQLVSPTFYISGYLERHREEYYERLLALSTERDWSGWIVYFLKAVTSQAKENSDKASKILVLYEQMKDVFREVTHSQYSQKLLDAIFSRPIFRPQDVITLSEIQKATGMTMIRLLRQEGVLETLQESRGRRPAILAFRQLVQIADS